ncbi:YadA-like family protein [Enterobacter cloacae]|uniref:YadA-like family protein n=1 Tax=Enterobacter cloacae TaxID=550 RepID=UPI00300F73E1
MKAVNTVKTLVAVAVLSSISANANALNVGDYLTQQGKEDFEYATGSNPDMGFIIKGETAVIGQTNGSYPSDFDLGKLVSDVNAELEHVTNHAKDQLNVNAEFADEIKAANDLAVDAHVQAANAQNTANQNKTDIADINTRLDNMGSVDISGKADKADLDALGGRVGSINDRVDDIETSISGKADKADLDAINTRIDNIAPVDISGKADKADLDAVKAIADQAAKDAQQAQGEVTGAVTVAIAAKETADQNKSDIADINNRLDNMPTVDVSNKADKADLDALGGRVGGINDRVDDIESGLSDINNRLDNIAPVDVSNKADKADLDVVSNKADQALAGITTAQDTANKAQEIAETASIATGKIKDDVDGLKNQILDKADKASVEAIAAAVSDKADKAHVDDAHAKADQINQILHGAPTTFDTDSTGDIGLIAKVDQNTTDIKVVSNQVSGIVDSVNTAASQAAEAVSKVDVATSKADNAVTVANNAQQTADGLKTEVSTASTKADNAMTTANTANQNASIAYNTANTAYNMAETTQKQVQKFDGRITNVENQVQGLNKSFSNLKNQVEKNRKEANAGIAGANAIASIPTIAGSRFSLGAGVGGFQGSQAVAVGATYNFNERVALKAGVSTSSASEVGYGVGISVGFN